YNYSRNCRGGFLPPMVGGAIYGSSSNGFSYPTSWICNILFKKSCWVKSWHWKVIPCYHTIHINTTTGNHYNYTTTIYSDMAAEFHKPIVKSNNTFNIYQM